MTRASTYLDPKIKKVWLPSRGALWRRTAPREAAHTDFKQPPSSGGWAGGRCSARANVKLNERRKKKGPDLPFCCHANFFCYGNGDTILPEATEMELECPHVLEVSPGYREGTRSAGIAVCNRSGNFCSDWKGVLHSRSNQIGGEKPAKTRESLHVIFLKQNRWLLYKVSTSTHIRFLTFPIKANNIFYFQAFFTRVTSSFSAKTDQTQKTDFVILILKKVLFFLQFLLFIL